jgi:cobyric acid synthase
MEMKGTHQLLVNADDVNLFGENINTIRDTQVLLDPNKEGGLDVNTEERR